MNIEKRQHTESLEAYEKNNPFKHPDIEKFFKENLGSGFNSFIPTMNLFAGYFYAIHELLTILDQSGGDDLYLNYNKLNENECLAGLSFMPPPNDAPTCKTTLRDYTLAVVERMVQEYRIPHYQIVSPDWPNLQLLEGGIAALSFKIALARGKDYCKHYSNDLCQGSLAFLEDKHVMPLLHNFKRIRDIIIHYYWFVNESRAFAYRKITDDSAFAIARVLINAEQQVKRRKFFESFVAPGGNEKKNKLINTEVAEIIKSAEKNRIEQSDQFHRDELKGLRNMQNLKAIIKIQDKLIYALENNNKQGIENLKGKLAKLKNDTPVPESSNAKFEKKSSGSR